MGTLSTPSGRKLFRILLLTAGLGYVLLATLPDADRNTSPTSMSTSTASAVTGEPQRSPKRFSAAQPRRVATSANPVEATAPSNAVVRPPIGDEALQRELDAAAPRDLGSLSRQGDLRFLDELLPGFENGVAIETYEDWHPAKHAEALPAIPVPAPRPYFDPDATQ